MLSQQKDHNLNIKKIGQNNYECSLLIPKEALENYKVEIVNDTINVSYDFYSIIENEGSKQEKRVASCFSYSPGTKIKESSARIEGENVLVVDLICEE